MIVCIIAHTPELFGEHEPVYICYTKQDVMGRLYQVQTYNPHDLELIGCWSGNSKDKANVHKLFEQHKIRGEWFKGVPELIQFIKESSEHSRAYKQYLAARSGR